MKNMDIYSSLFTLVLVACTKKRERICYLLRDVKSFTTAQGITSKKDVPAIDLASQTSQMVEEEGARKFSG